MVGARDVHRRHADHLRPGRLRRDAAASAAALNLVVVRHAPAGHADPARWPDDADRPLSEDGVARFREGARGLVRLVPRVDAVLASGFARAWQTAELLHEAGWPAPAALRELEVGVPPIAVVGVLRQRGEGTLALVGHEPQLSRLVSLVCTGDERALALELKKGAAVALECAAPVEPGAAWLRWALPPKVLRGR